MNMVSETLYLTQNESNVREFAPPVNRETLCAAALQQIQRMTAIDNQHDYHQQHQRQHRQHHEFTEDTHIPTILHERLSAIESDIHLLFRYVLQKENCPSLLFPPS
jgi:hypothetical protein